MDQTDDLYKIAVEEANETFESFTDLDSISDTTVLAITFLLSAQVTLSALLLNSSLFTTDFGQSIFVLLGLLTILLIFFSLNAIVKALLPVGYYGPDVGQPLLDYKWIPIGNTGADQFNFLQQSATADDSHEAINGDVNMDRDIDSVRQAAENFVEHYSTVEEIRDHETYEYAKLDHFKQVGKRKAKYTGVGLAWLRLAVIFFLLQFLVLFWEVISV